ncbi:MAG: glucose-1-phosphate cytidylyltransferase [Acidimicrobiia bacterium]|nr:glucose-1-phosphate cytidylyltransferase [Acidimicrobiia bacterium]
MKTVLLCGGFGTRIRDVADDIPKPLIKVGEMPILWHLMGYYATFGYTEFVLCLGYKSNSIVDFFRQQPGDVQLLANQDELTSIHKFSGPVNKIGCSVTMADTGLEAMTGARLRKIKSLIGDETFMLSYGDGLSDIDIAKLVAHHRSGRKLLTVTGVRPPSRFGELQVDDANNVTGFNEKPQASGGRISGGFFVCEPGVFNYLESREDLVFEKEPIQSIVHDKQMDMYAHDEFWQCMDTYRDWELLNQMFKSGKAPWVR